MVGVDGEFSNWKSVLSEVPQEYELHPILCLIYINDLDEGVTSKILKLEKDTKLFRNTTESGDKTKLQDDLDKLDGWSGKWQMFSILGNVNVHTGPGNTGMNYEMAGTILVKP